jgi:hypothetical protein
MYRAALLCHGAGAGAARPAAGGVSGICPSHVNRSGAARLRAVLPCRAQGERPHPLPAGGAFGTWF